MATTPGFGFPYPATTDAPCAMDDSLAALDARLDALDAQWDANIALAQNPPFVKISRSNFAWNPFLPNQVSSAIQFDTLEINRGTSTDLTVDSTSLYVPAGYWIVGASVNVAPTAATGGLYIQANLSGASSTNADRLAGIQNFFDPETSTVIGNKEGPVSVTGSTISFGSTPSQIQLQMLIAGTFSGTPPAFLAYYMTLWAFKMADNP